MALLDERGARLPINVLASVGVNSKVTFKGNGVVRPITTEEFFSDIKDDETGKTISTQSHTVTDAPNGIFQLSIPYSVFAGKEDEEFSHETYFVDTDGKRVPLMYGLITIEARG